LHFSSEYIDNIYPNSTENGTEGFSIVLLVVSEPEFKKRKQRGQIIPTATLS
jgi:hypothetical protein